MPKVKRTAESMYSNTSGVTIQPGETVDVPQDVYDHLKNTHADEFDFGEKTAPKKTG